MHEILSNEIGKKLFLLGNEAIVRGALEAGIDVAAAYPGTPSSEIGDTFFALGRDSGAYFEYSTNEKVATEVAAAASACGLRSMTFMKHVGLNVAADAFMTMAYQGVRGGFVLVSADDPSCHSSQNEQDNRYYSLLANVPMLEPSSPQEAKEMTRVAFDLSEKVELPFILRTTTRINHMRGPVTIGKLGDQRKKGHFEKDPGRFVTIPVHARKRHAILLRQMEKLAEISETIEFNNEIDLGGSEVGVISSGVAFNYALDVMKGAGIKGKILKLGLTHPLPKRKCLEFMKSVDKVVIVEELEPWLEEQLRSLAQLEDLEVEIFGKDTGNFSRLFEYTPDTVKDALAQILEINFPDNKLVPRDIPLPNRPPTLCPGCPHRHTYYAVKKALKDKFKETIFSSDIGCYSLGIQKPYEMADYILCMGSSVDAAGGFSKATDQPVMAFIGDSTFFHSGIHGLINAVYNKHKFVLTIMDNRTTAMTGHQPNPGMGISSLGEHIEEISIRSIVNSCGVDFIRIVDPNDLERTVKAYEDALNYDGVAVIITKRPCILLEVRGLKQAGRFQTFHIDEDTCKKCKICTEKFGCPAIFKDPKGTIMINEAVCLGCGFCVEVCPFDAIRPSGGGA